MPCLIPRLLFPAALLLALAPCRGADEPETVEIHGPDIHPGYPDFLNFSYMLAEGSTSPDHQYGVIHPTHAAWETTPVRQDFLVGLHPFRVLDVLKTDRPYFEGENHGDFAVKWSADSSTALVDIEARWGPHAVILLELRGGRVVRQTDLAAEVHRLLRPDFLRSHAESYNGAVDFILVTDDSVRLDAFSLGNDGRVRIRCTGETNPNSAPGLRSWSTRVDAVWDVAQAKFLTEKLTSFSARPQRK